MFHCLFVQATRENSDCNSNYRGVSTIRYIYPTLAVSCLYCLYVCLSIYWYVNLSVCLLVCLFIFCCVFPVVCLFACFVYFVWLCVCVCVCVCVCAHARLCMCLFVCLSVSLLVCPSVCIWMSLLINKGQFRDKLYEADNMLFKGTKIIILSTTRPEMLQIIYEGHQGLERTRSGPGQLCTGRA